MNNELQNQQIAGADYDWRTYRERELFGMSGNHFVYKTVASDWSTGSFSQVKYEES